MLCITYRTVLSNQFNSLPASWVSRLPFQQNITTYDLDFQNFTLGSRVTKNRKEGQEVQERRIIPQV